MSKSFFSIFLKVSIFCFLIVISSNFALAKTVPNIYGIDIPVSSQGEDVREQALKDAFRQVIVKVSGSLEALNKPSIKKELKNADDYVRAYSYSSSTDASGFILHVEFNSALLHSLLKQAGLSSWSSSRPTILVWMIVRDSKHAPVLIDQNSTQTAAKIFQRSAEARGIPLIFPIGDIDEISSVQTDDIIAQNSDSLIKLSKRYAPDVFVLVDVFIHSANSVEIHWLFVNNSEHTSGSVQNSDLGAGLNGVINSLADELVRFSKSAGLSNKTNRIAVQVIGLTGASDYQEVMRYLKHMNGIVSVQALDITADEANFQVAFKGDEAKFKQEIGFATLLEQTQSESSDVTSTSLPLVYRYHKSQE